jgi:predicted metal-binding protein
MTAPQDREIWYRYIEVQYAHIDPDTERVSASSVHLQVQEFVVDRHTPKCVVLRRTFGEFTSTQTHVVRRDAHKRFAYPTRAEALASFKARKAAQIRILEAQLGRARQALGQASMLDGAAYQPGQIQVHEPGQIHAFPGD